MKRMALLWIAMLSVLSACAQPSALPTPTPTVHLEPPSPVPTPTPTLEPMAARGNGIPILLADYERQVASYETTLVAQGLDASTAEGQQRLAEARAWILDQMIEQVLMEQAAIQAGLSVSDDEVDASVQSLEAELGPDVFAARLAQEGLTLENLRAELKRQLLISKIASQVVENVPQSAEHVRARHILLATQEEAEQVLAQLQAGADFAQLAMQVSQDLNTRINGGELGYFPRGVLTASEVEQAAFALEPGQISGVIHSALGYHIVQVLDKGERAISPEHRVLLQDKALRDWLAGLWASATIERFVTTTP